MPPDDVSQLVAQLFRQESAKITALLVHLFGLRQMELAEDIVQDTLIDALHQWQSGEIPQNPSAWLLQVAKRKTINYLKREALGQRYQNAQKEVEEETIAEVLAEEKIADSQLRMMFAACHPSLPIESQVALTLKTLCGFRVPEIAHVLLTSIANIHKRLYRAKQKFREGDMLFELPPESLLTARLDAVFVTLYLLFNSGYQSSHTESLIREELCAEAIRLLALVMEQFPDQPKGYALLALMHLHAARLEARLDTGGSIILFEDQDRNKWDKELISRGIFYLQKAATGGQMSEYHLEAGIAASYCMSKNFAATNWRSIYQQYEWLYAIKPSPVIELNMAIVASKTEGLTAAIERLETLEQSGNLKDYYLLPASLGTFYGKQGQSEKAQYYLQKAIRQTEVPAEVKLLEERLRRFRKE